MSVLPDSVQNVIEEVSKIPGIGPKSATRIAYHFVRAGNRSASKLADALVKMDENVRFCTSCFNISEKDECDICSSPIRDSSLICIVEEPLDVMAFEKSGIYKGKYFVLGGVISPADGVGVEEIRMRELKTQLSKLLKTVEKLELIVATNPSLEGEATAHYIADMVSELDKEGKITVTRLAMGLPTGADLEYADQLTLRRAFEGRNKL